MYKQYCVKLVKYGNFYEWFEYELPLLTNNRSKFTKNYSSDEITEKTVYRAKKRIRELLLCNQSLNKFITLTFKNVYNYSSQLRFFYNFRRKLQRFIKYDLKYLAVPEYGSKFGRFHFHMVSNQPYIKKSKLADMWGKGFVQVNLIDNSDQIASYLSKYLSKDFKLKVLNKKMYYYSKNLSQPVVYRDEDALAQFNTLDLKLSARDMYLHPFLGTVKKLTYFVN
jgi:hypothetical protein